MKTKNNRGFSLVELLVGISIMAILLAGVTGLLSSGVKSMQFDRSVGTVLAPGRNAIQRISDYLRYDAVTITAPASLGGSGSTITFADGQATPVSYSIYYDNGTRSVVVTKGGVVQERLASGLVNSLTFTRDAVDKRGVTIEIALNDRSYPDSPNRTLSSTILMLNVK